MRKLKPGELEWLTILREAEIEEQKWSKSDWLIDRLVEIGTMALVVAAVVILMMFLANGGI